MADFTLRGLLGRALKSDELIELLEDEDMEVIYQFDRIHEGGKDRYWTANRSAGYELHFDDKQRLKTIFCYLVATDTFRPIDPALIGVPIYRTFDEAKRNADAQGVSYVTPNVKKYPDMAGKYLRMDLPDYSVHYQFKKRRLDMITLMLEPP
jgi:hypothetical protein